MTIDCHCHIKLFLTVENTIRTLLKGSFQAKDSDCTYQIGKVSLAKNYRRSCLQALSCTEMYKNEYNEFGLLSVICHHCGAMQNALENILVTVLCLQYHKRK